MKPTLNDFQNDPENAPTITLLNICAVMFPADPPQAIPYLAAALIMVVRSTTEIPKDEFLVKMGRIWDCGILDTTGMQ